MLYLLEWDLKSRFWFMTFDVISQKETFHIRQGAYTKSRDLALKAECHLY